jgi:hypothetical protein
MFTLMQLELYSMALSGMAASSLDSNLTELLALDVGRWHFAIASD